LRHDEISECHNISFDSDEARDTPDASSAAIQSRQLTVSSVQVLGNLTHKNNEHILNTIMRQVDCNDLIESLGYPNRTVWIRDNIPIWFGTRGILAG